jgi:HEPN domain-containing protein
MVDAFEFARWRQASEDTARAARVQSNAGIHNWACFLAEQAAQLAVKGLLHGIGAGAWGHDLVALGRALAENADLAIPQDVQAALRRLSRHYIPARYPDAHPSGPPALYYGAADVEQALADLILIHGFVDFVWRQLDPEDKPRPEADEE